MKRVLDTAGASGVNACTTCGDSATPAQVIAVRADGVAVVELPDGGHAEVSVELVNAGPGDVVLVHAGVAIGVLS